MATHHKGGTDHLGPKGGAPEKGAAVTNRQTPAHGAAPQRGDHGHGNQTPPTGGKMSEGC